MPEGREIDFKNTVIILTSNCSHRYHHALLWGTETVRKQLKLADILRPELATGIQTGLLGPAHSSPYPIRDEIMRKIIQ